MNDLLNLEASLGVLFVLWYNNITLTYVRSIFAS